MHPVLLNIGGFELRSYGVAVALAFLVGIISAAKLAKREKLNEETVYDIGVAAIISSIIGARILYVIVNFDFFSKNPVSVFKVWEGGLVFYGGLAGAITGTWIYLRIKKISFFDYADIFAPLIALGHAIGRVGCFLNGCCYGAVDHKYGIIMPGAGDGLPHLPVQLYESGLNFINFIFLFFWYLKLRKKRGEVMFVYMISYSVIRFFMEFFRGDEERGFIMSLSTSTAISIVLFLAGITGFILLRSGKIGKENIKT